MLATPCVVCIFFFFCNIFYKYTDGGGDGYITGLFYNIEVAMLFLVVNPELAMLFLEELLKLVMNAVVFMLSPFKDRILFVPRPLLKKSD